MYMLHSSGLRVRNVLDLLYTGYKYYSTYTLHMGWNMIGVLTRNVNNGCALLNPIKGQVHAKGVQSHPNLEIFFGKKKLTGEIWGSLRDFYVH